VEFELVLIDKALSKERFRHLDKAVHPSERYPKGRISPADLLELQQWLKQETYGPKQQKWKEHFSQRSHVVGFDSEIETLLAPDQTAVGIDLAHIRARLKAGLLKKPDTPSGIL
jgi:hypothetical protein